MKATNVIIIGGGAIALLYFLKNRKVKTISIAKPNVSTIPTTGGATTGGATAGTSQVTSFPTPPQSNEPEQVFGLGLPTGMDLPILTAGTGIPTEVAIQQGGVSTTPEPVKESPQPSQPINDIIEPIKEPRLPINDDPYKGQIGGFPQYPAPPQPIDDIIEPIRFPMPSIIDPISIEVTNPSVFTKEPNYIAPAMPNIFEQIYDYVMPSKPIYSQPVDVIVEPIIEPRRLYDIDPISIEVTNPSVFTKEPNYVMPVIQNSYQQEFSNVDRELFNMNQDIYSI
jgi:hypothetical protein